MKNGNNYWWLIFLVVFFLGSGDAAAIIIALIVILALIGALSRRSGNTASRSSSRTSTRYRSSSTSSQGRTRASRILSPSEMAKINVYLRRYFNSNETLQVADGILLKVHKGSYSSLSSLDIYRNGEYLGALEEFGTRYGDSYDAIIRLLLANAENGYVVRNDGVIDVTAEEHKKEAEQPKKEPAQKKEEKKKDCQYFIDEINRLNTDIPDEKISKGLYETTSLLRQIHDLEEKFPESRSKLDKLYDYYLPILIRILTQYESLQNVTTDPSYQDTYDKLNRTIGLINDAMRTIISSMTDEDFINLSADISTLEAVLQKDGYAGNGRMNPDKKEEK